MLPFVSFVKPQQVPGSLANKARGDLFTMKMSDAFRVLVQKVMTKLPADEAFYVDWLPSYLSNPLMMASIQLVLIHPSESDDQPSSPRALQIAAVREMTQESRDMIEKQQSSPKHVIKQAVSDCLTKVHDLLSLNAEITKVLLEGNLSEHEQEVAELCLNASLHRTSVYWDGQAQLRHICG